MALDPRNSHATPFVLARAILDSSHSRRTAMGVFLVVSAALLFLGVGPLSDFVMAGPWRFVLFWGLTLLVTLLTFGLALLEVLKTFQSHREELSALRSEIPASENESSDSQE